MADIPVGRLEATLGVNTREYDKTMRQVQRSLRAQSRQFQQIGRSLSRSLTLPITLAGAAITAAAVNFDREMRRVQALTGATAKQFEALSDQAKVLGSTTAFSASQAAAGMGFLAQTGFEVSEILETLPGALNLAAAGGIDLARAADIASNVLQSFRLEANQMNRVGDALALTFSSSNVNLEQLADAMKLIAPTAKAVGYSMEETAAAIGLLGDAGLQGTIAGTSLNQSINKLLDTTAQSEEAMRNMGLVVRDQAGNLLHLVDIIAQLEAKAASATDVIRIFGIRGGRAINTLIGRSEELRRFTKNLADAGGTAKRIAEEQLAGLYGILVRLKSAAEGAALALAEGGIGQIVSVLGEKITQFTRWITQLDEATRKTIVAIGLTAAIVPVLITALGGILAVVAVLVPLFKGLAAAVGTGGAVMAALLAISGVAGGTATSFHLLRSAMRDTKEITPELAQALKDLGVDVDEAISSIDKSLSILDATVASIDLTFEIAEVARESELLDKKVVDALWERHKELQARIDSIAETQLPPLEIGVSLQVSIEDIDPQAREAAIARQRIFDTIAAVHEEVQTEMRVLQQQSKLLGVSLDMAAEKAKILEDAVVELLRKGVKPSEALLQEMAADVRRLNAEVSEGEAMKNFAEMLREVQDRIMAIEIDPLAVQLQQGIREIQDFAIAANLSADAAQDMIDEYTAAFARFREVTEEAAEIAKQKAAQEELQRQLEQPFLNAAENIQREFGNLFTDLFRGGVDSFEDLADTIKDIWARMAGEMMAMAIFQPAAFFGGGQAAGTAAGGLGSWLFGGAGIGFSLGEVFQSITDLFRSEERAVELRNIRYQEEAARYATELGMPTSGVEPGWTGAGRFGGAQGLLGLAGAAIAGGFTGYLIGQQVGQNPAEKIGWTVGGFIGSAIGTYFTKGMGGSSGIGQLFTYAGGFILSSIMGTWYDVIQGENPLATRQKWRNVSRAMFMDPTLMLLAQIGVFEPPPIKAQVATRPVGGDLAEFQKRYAQISPFGMVGLYGPGTQQVEFQSMAGLTTQIRQIDEMVAKYMTDIQVSRVAQALQMTTAFQAKSKTDISDKIFNVIADRLNVIFTALIGPETKMTHTGLHLQAQLTSLLDDLKAGNQANISVLLERVQEFLAARAELSNMLDYIVRESTVGISEGEKAVEQLAAQFDQLAEQAQALGIAEERVAEARTAALSALRREFAENIEDKILALTDTFMLSVVQMQRAQEERLASARALGADLVEVERLNLLERQRLLEDINEPIKTFMEDLYTGLGSPFAPSVIEEAAEERFRALASQVSAGEFVEPEVLVEAASAFLDASRVMHASSVAFFDAVALVEEVLNQARVTELPGFQSGGSFTIPGGGHDNVVPLFRVSGSERIDVTSRSARVAEDRLLQGIGEAIEEGNAATLAEGRELRTQVERMADAIESNQAAIARLANKKSA